MKRQTQTVTLGDGRLATEKPLIRAAKEKGGQLSVAPPNPEVQDKAVRRHFTAEYKLRILTLADACTEAGSMGALLRREGLYASNLNTWRHQRDLKSFSSTDYLQGCTQRH